MIFADDHAAHIDHVNHVDHVNHADHVNHGGAQFAIGHGDALTQHQLALQEHEARVQVSSPLKLWRFTIDVIHVGVGCYHDDFGPTVITTVCNNVFI